MTFLPIVGREMRVAARLRGLYAGRTIAALLCLIIGWFLYASMRGQPLYEKGRILFIVLSWTCLVVSLGAGPWLTCDSLSEEKRTGTLGLLFLTDLRGYDVVAGKLASGALSGLFSILAVVPVLALTLLMGGQTWGEILRCILVLTASLPLSLAIGLFASACCRKARKALALCLGLLLMLNAVIPLAGGLLQDRFSPAEWPKLFFLTTPGCALACFGDNDYRLAHGYFWGALGVAWGLALALLAAASVITPRAWQEKNGALREGGLRSWWHRLRMGGTGWRQRFRARALAANPYFWLCSRERWTRYFVWIIFLAIGMVYAFGWHEDGRRFIDTSVNVTCLLIAGALLKIWWISHAAGRLGEDRAINVLELMLTTPLTERAILRGQWRSLFRTFRWPMAFFLLLLVAAAAFDWRRHEEIGKYICYLLVSLADLASAGWLAMWLSLRLAKPYRAYLLTCLVALALPWLVYFCFVMFIVLIGGFRGGDPFVALLVLWTMFCLFWSGSIGGIARFRLIMYFRVVAATPTGTKPVYPPARWPSPLPPQLPEDTAQT